MHDAALSAARDCSVSASGGHVLLWSSVPQRGRLAGHFQRGRAMAMNTSFVVCLLAGFLGAVAACAQERLDRDNLLLYRNQVGAVQPVKTMADWGGRRAEIVQSMESVMGKFPAKDRRVELDVQIEETADVGSYERLLITYQSEPDSRTPAYLCIPKHARNSARKTPAVLCLHPTDNVLGHKVVVGLGGRNNRQYAAELAERGYVTISPAYPQLANYWPNLAKLDYVSGSMKAIWDNSRAVDVLENLEDVAIDTQRGFGAIGHSLGGHNAIYTAVFDERISVIVSSCGFDAFVDYYDGDERNWNFGKGWCQTRYMPKMSDYRGRLDAIPFDFTELLGALAPRPVYVNAPLGDGNFRWKSVDRCARAAEPVYRLAGADGRLVVEHPDCVHDFPAAQREAAYKTIDSVLKAK
ncbi:MAG: acetylxylan esterase [Planctomycetales bacterium]|nr:acetylxylan esterase [Planctomycetales bacterium]